MKRIGTLCLAMALLGVSATAAEAPLSAPARPPAPLPLPSLQPSAVPMPETVRLSVKGYISNLDVELDFSLAVSGNEFYLRNAMENPADKANKINVIFRGALRKTETGYQVEYALNCQVPFVTSQTSQISAKGNVTSQEIHYRNVGVEGAVLLQPGRPMTVLEQQGRKLTILLTKTPETLPVKIITHTNP